MRRLVCVVVSLMVLTSSLCYASEATTYGEYADKLAELNVFQGTNKGFELERPPSRLEGLIMLIRLLGKEDDALATDTSYSYFSDVDPWGVYYTNYAYEQGLTDGIGNGLFGADRPIDAKSYHTFLLRALGYDDEAGDFQWETANEFIYRRGIISDEYYEDIMVNTFLRDHVAKSSYDALQSNMRLSSKRLADVLIESGDIDGDIIKRWDTYVEEDYIVSFVDENLEAVIRETLDIATDDIMKSDVLGIRALIANGKQIKELTGIEELSNISDLQLTDNEIVDPSPLYSLTNIKSLHVTNNLISYDDFNMLLSQFPHAWVTGQPQYPAEEDYVVDFPDRMLDEEVRRVINKPTEDIMKSDLLNITGFHCSEKGVKDITGIGEMINLEDLYMYSNEISDISELENLTKLVVVKLYNNKISDISALSGLTELEHLNIFSNEIDDLSGLEGLANLTFITLFRNQVTDISPLIGVTSLENLDLRSNNISDIDLLFEMTFLKKLYIDDISEEDLELLKDKLPTTSINPEVTSS